MSTEHGSEGAEGETSTDGPSGKICTWHPDEEETTSPTLNTDSGHVTVTPPPVYPQSAGEEQTVMAAAEVPAARQEGISGTCTQQQSTKTTSGVSALLIAKKKFLHDASILHLTISTTQRSAYIYILTCTASFPLILEGCVINCYANLLYY